MKDVQNDQDTIMMAQKTISIFFIWKALLTRLLGRPHLQMYSPVDLYTWVNGNFIYMLQGPTNI